MSSRPIWRLVLSSVVVISCVQVLRSIGIERYVEGVPGDIWYYVDNLRDEESKSPIETRNDFSSKDDSNAVVESLGNVDQSGDHVHMIEDDEIVDLNANQSLGSLESLNQTLPTHQTSLKIPEHLSRASRDIPIDSNSTVTADISKIWHDTEKGSVCVNLKENARCPHPAFLGRLSGPALAMLDWKEKTVESGNGTMLCGEYSNKWLDAGEYYVEIIILYCEDFGVGALEGKNETIWLGTDFKKKCTEDAMHNRITAKEGSVITITLPTEGKGNYRLGRWVRRVGIPSRPLFTRYQPVGCTDPRKQYKGLEPLPEWCEALVRRDKPNTGKYLWRSKKGAEEVFGLPEYEFQWRMNIMEEELVERLNKRLHDASKRLPKICGIGDSHSRMMEERSLPQLNLTGIFDFLQSYWVAPKNIAGKVRKAKCDKIFVQIGQWAPSWYTKGKPFSFEKYHKKMKLFMENALKVLENNTNAKIYLPTIDQGPLMARVNACNDWRTPTVQDAYSKVLQIIQRDLAATTGKVEYIDTNFIIYTHWDGHLDWTHLLEDVRYRKTIYILALILGELHGLGD